jgi:hypothetical protein
MASAPILAMNLFGVVPSASRWLSLVLQDVEVLFLGEEVQVLQLALLVHRHAGWITT